MSCLIWSVYVLCALLSGLRVIYLVCLVCMSCLSGLSFFLPTSNITSVLCTIFMYFHASFVIKHPLCQRWPVFLSCSNLEILAIFHTNISHFDKLLHKQPHIETTIKEAKTIIIEQNYHSMFAAYIMYHVAIKIFSSGEVYNDTQNTTPSKFNID